MGTLAYIIRLSTNAPRGASTRGSGPGLASQLDLTRIVKGWNDIATIPQSLRQSNIFLE